RSRPPRAGCGRSTERPSGRSKVRWVRKPTAHFVAIGIALFALERYTTKPLPGTPKPMVVITAGRLVEARARVGPAAPRPPAPAGRGVGEGAVDEEILYHEALARGLDRTDPAVHYRLVEKARFLVEGETGTSSGTDDELYSKAIALGLDRDDAMVR